LTKASNVFQLCVEASRNSSWVRFSPESVPSNYAATPSLEGPNYAAWAKSFQEAATKITQSCKVAYPYDVATVCRWMPECDDYLVVLAESVMNGTTVCDKARYRNLTPIAPSNPRPFCKALCRPTASAFGRINPKATCLSYDFWRHGGEKEPLGEGGCPLTNALRPHLSLAKRWLAPSAKRWASRRSFDTSTPMVSFCIFSAPLLVIRGSPPSIRPGQRKRRGRSNSSSTRQTVSELPICPSPLTRGQPPSPSGSFSPPWRQKS
jgi:hypothetical protein